MGDVLQTMEFRLAYSECDPAGIIYYAAYHPWMERAHTNWAYDQGIRLDESMQRWGASSVARHCSVSYLQAARIFDPLRVEMRLDRLGTSSMTLRFDFSNRDTAATVAVGSLTLVCIGRDGRPTRIPESMREQLLSGGDPSDSLPAGGL
jgi:acyl-CoA thioester hydrolase